MTHPLYEHAPRPHQHHNANDTSQLERSSSNFFEIIVDWIIDKTATVQGLILFLCIGTGSLVGYVTGNTLLAIICGALSSYILQLVYLVLLLISQKHSDRARQIQSDEIYKFASNASHDTDEMTHHMGEQDRKLIHIHADVELLKQAIAQLCIDFTDRDNANATLLASILTRLDTSSQDSSRSSSIIKRITHPLKQKH